MKYGIKVETYQVAGRYEHKVYDLGLKTDKLNELSNDVVEAQKKVNEKVWQEMPVGAKGLVAIIQYETSKK